MIITMLRVFTLQFLLCLIVITTSQKLPKRRITASSKPLNEAQLAVFGCSSSVPKAESPAITTDMYFDIDANNWKFIPKRLLNKILRRGAPQCVENDVDAFNLCKELYKTKNVINVMRVSEAVKFDATTTCGGDDKECVLFENQYIQPYKCLYEPYEAQSLLVPPNCEFKSLFNEDCKSQEYWLGESSKACAQQNTLLNDSRLLKWCSSDKIGQFTGVEFICCLKEEIKKPEVVKPDATQVIEDENIDDDDDDDDSDEDDLNDDNSVGDVPNRIIDTVINSDKASSSAGAAINKEELDRQDDDAETIEGDIEEQKRYKDRIASIENEFNDKKVDITSRWNAELKQFVDLVETTIDRETVNKLYKQKLVDNDKEKLKNMLQNELTHNDILQADITNDLVETTSKVTKLLDKYKDLTQISDYNKQQVNDLLDELRDEFKELFYLYERNRLLQITIYKRLQAQYPDGLQSQLSRIVDTLKRTSENIEKYKKMITNYNLPFNFDNIFDNYKMINDEAEKLVGENVSASNNLDAAGVLPDGPAIDNNLVVATTTPIQTTTDADDDASDEDTYDTYENDDEDDDDDDIENESGSDDSNEIVKPKKKSTTTTTTTTTTTPQQVNADEDDDDDDDDSDEDDNNEIPVFNNNDYDPLLNQVQNNKQLSVDQNDLPNSKKESKYRYNENDQDDDVDDDDDVNPDAKKSIGSTSSTAIVLIVTICVFSVIIVFSLVVLIIRYKQYSSLNTRFFNSKNRHAFQQLDQCSPEEQHVNQMQINGYENPAYKFFEQNQA